MKIKCDHCSKPAVWLYMPGSAAACDDHVPRGCSCNSELKEGISYESEEAKDSKNYEEKLDDKSRRWPCCEWTFDEKGFDTEEPPLDLAKELSEDWLKKLYEQKL
jgi:hypothetical protein